MRRTERNWSAVAATVQGRSTAAMRAALARTASSLTYAATAALDAPSRRGPAFRAMQRLTAPEADQSVVLYRGAHGRAPFAWAGPFRTPIDTAANALGVVRTPFYVALQASVRRGPDRAIATAVVHADQPANRLASSLDEHVAARTGVLGFTVLSATDALAGDSLATVAPGGGAAVLALQPITPHQTQATLRATERAQRRGALAVGLALALFLACEWRPGRAARFRRLGALAVALGVLAILPLNTFSNATQLFDPTYYFSTIAGPYTANIGAVTLAGAAVVLAALAAARARLRIRPPVLAGTLAVAIALTAPFVVRRLAAGITPPGAGVPLTIWIAWQLALALVGTAILVTAGAVGRGAFGSGAGTIGRGFAPLLGVWVAAGAAALGPFLWQVPGRFPGWYAIPWCAAVAAVALARPTKCRVVAPAIVAGLGAALLVWSTTAERRVTLAEEDVAGLNTPDVNAEALLAQFADEIALAPPPETRADLLKLYARSELAAASYPVALAVWSGTEGLEAPSAELSLARFRTDMGTVAAAVSAARLLDTAVLTQAIGSPGVQLVLAVPHPLSPVGDAHSVTTVVVAPQTRLIPESPVAPLLGLPADTTATPLYTISLLEGYGQRYRQDSEQASDSAAGPPAVADTGVAVRWVRHGSELHGDWLVHGVAGPARAHLEVELRPFDALAERAVLLLVVDLLAVAALWILSAVGDGAVWRWLRARGRLWRRSYRMQLTLVLFAFFVAPTVVFAIWSERRLRSDDEQARSLRIAETLRSVVAEDELDRLPTAEQRLGVPLLLYARGALTATSDTLYAQLASLGLLLHPDIELSLGIGDEVIASRTTRLAGVRTLVGYRAATEEDGRHVVLAAPEGADEVALDRRSADLSVLVLFTVVLGASAALWLSGLAARQLARPIDALRRAALAMARGEREPPLAGDPPVEFGPVFSAFRRMAADFGASQRVLAWGEMARQVAHEIKNPLTPIRLGVQHLLRARADGRADFDRILHQNASRILGEIDRLDEIARAFSRYGTAPAERPPAEPTDVAALARDVVALERMSGGVMWDLRGGDHPVMVRARAEELREVLLNVLENARLAQAGRVTLRLAAIPARDGAPGRVTVTVEDNGEGIPADVLPRIFEPHFSTRTSGSGLGLAVSRRIVDGWGGSMAVASERGRGTRVTITLLSDA